MSLPRRFSSHAMSSSVVTRSESESGSYFERSSYLDCVDWPVYFSSRCQTFSVGTAGRSAPQTSSTRLPPAMSSVSISASTFYVALNWLYGNCASQTPTLLPFGMLALSHSPNLGTLGSSFIIDQPSVNCFSH